MNHRFNSLAALLAAGTLATALSTSAIAQEEITAEAEQPTPEQLEEMRREYEQQRESIWKAMEKKQGSVPLPNGVATLNVPDTFVYISPEDTEQLLVELWGNRPSEGRLQGMLLPAGISPLADESWAVTIDYQDDGYVSDKDAGKLKYDKLLKQMQDETSQASAAREAAGYESIELVGWAADPYYDQEAHKMHWAKELKFGGMDENTLNYNVRALGRKGVLVMNFIASMEQKGIIDRNLDSVVAMSNFNDGYKYSEFQPGVDKVAAYGIGALIAGKAIAKTGMLAAALIFLKKFGIFILIGIGALGAKLFRRK